MITITRRIITCFVIIFLLLNIFSYNLIAFTPSSLHKLPSTKKEETLSFARNTTVFFPTMQPEPIMLDETLPKPSIQQTPSSFTWTDNNGDWTTPAKNQGECGSCWSFAALSILESKINIKENNPKLDPDLSEQYVLSCLPSAGSCRGGNTFTALELIKKTTSSGNGCNGVILESCFPYQADDDISCGEKCVMWEEYLVPLTDYGRFDSDGSTEDIQRIKTHIINHGPIVASIYASDEFKQWGMMHHNPTDYYPFSNPVYWRNHVVSIVGWHDDAQIGNGGYWICKNSWGSFWGYNGFFNIEYGTQAIDYGSIIWVDYDEQDFDWAPVANPNGPYVGQVNEPIVLSSTDSFDVEGDLVEYHWMFSDGTSASGQSVNHIFTENGIYDVSLTVTDESGKQNTRRTAVFINPWSEGNTWTYLFDELSCHIQKGFLDIQMQGNIPSFTLTVDKETSDSYELSIDGIIQGTMLLTYAGMQLHPTLPTSDLSGTLRISKKNMSITYSSIQMEGRVQFPDLLPIPISFPYTTEIQIDCSSGFTPIVFPLIDNTQYTIPGTEINIDGFVSSKLLKILYFVNTIARLVNNEFIPEDIETLLPTINIKEALDHFLGSNSFTTPFIPDLSVKESMRSVQAGIFPVYELSLPSDIGRIWYSKEIQNIIEVDVLLPTISLPNGSIHCSVHGELISTNYN